MPRFLFEFSLLVFHVIQIRIITADVVFVDLGNLLAVVAFLFIIFWVLFIRVSVDVEKVISTGIQHRTLAENPFDKLISRPILKFRCVFDVCRFLSAREKTHKLPLKNCRGSLPNVQHCVLELLKSYLCLSSTSGTGAAFVIEIFSEILQLIGVELSSGLVVFRDRDHLLLHTEGSYGVHVDGM